MENCIFCQIAKGKLEAKFHFESKNVMAFDDLHPVASIHILIVPKEHISSFMSISDTHLQIFSEMIKVAQELVKGRNLQKDQYRLVFNGGQAQHVGHLHWHFLGGALESIPQ